MAGGGTEILFILILVVANGVFSMAESAVVASRKARLQQSAQEGDTKARAALELAESPNRFLATVQIGITLIGILSGAFGGATLSKSLGEIVRGVPVLAPYADSIGLGIVVLVITYLSLVIGELVPKRLALHSPERIASFIAGPMRTLSFIAGPFVTILDVSTGLVLRIFGLKASDEPPVTEEEIKVMVQQGTDAGVFAAAEQDIIERVFRLGDRNVESIMTRRPDVVWLDLDDSWERNRHKMASSVYSRLPVCHGDMDHVVGVVRAKDILTQYMEGQAIDLATALQPAVFVPETLPALKLLESLKQARTHIGFVIDEHGGTVGLVTLQDILGAIVGDLPSVDESDEPDAVQREDGSWLLDGMMAIEDVKQIFDIDELPGDETGNYSTLSGFVMSEMGRVPTASEHFDAVGLRFEVLDMDGHRIDKVLVAPLEETNK
ncbi:MAG TPA: hemolysin family protein [Abditibacteriaceae bacterium]|jgi:putative hemolysin